MSELVYAGLATLGIAAVLLFLTKKKKTKFEEHEEKKEEYEEYEEATEMSAEEIFERHSQYQAVKRIIEERIVFLKEKIQKLALADISFEYIEELNILKLEKNRIEVLIEKLNVKKYVLFLSPEEKRQCLYRIVSRIENWHIMPAYFAGMNNNNAHFLRDIYLKARESFASELIKQEKIAIDLELGGKK